MAAYDVTFGSNSGIQVGHNSGTIVHTAAKRKLEKVFCVPDILSPNFIGRKDELKRISEIHRDSPRCIIHGMPGLGKSQLALKYAHTARDIYSYVFWLSASSVEKFESGFAEIMGYVFEDTEKTIPATRRWLEGTGKWLLIIDNVSSEALSSLRSILPQKGSVLYTTRFEHVAHSLCSPQRRIELQVLSPADSANLFIATRKYLDQETPDPEGINLIVKKIGHLPLAIDHAASLSVAPGQSIASVLEIYQGPDILEAITWENDLGLHEEPSVFSCFQPILDQVRQHSPAAFHLLCMLAFLDPENIPLWMLEQGLRSDEVVAFTPELKVEIGPSFHRLHSTFKSPIQKQKAIQALIRSSLVKYKSTKAFWIHDVTHLLLHQYFLGKQQQRSIWLGVTVNIIDRIATQEDPEDTFHRHCSNVQSLVVHVEQIRKYLDRYEHESYEFLCVEALVVSLLGMIGRHEAARKIGEKALPKIIKSAGIPKAVALDVMYALVFSCCEGGRLGDAEPLLLASIKLAKSEYGLAHKDTLDHMTILALVYTLQGRENEAMELTKNIQNACKELPPHEWQAYVQQAWGLAELFQLRQQWQVAEHLKRTILLTRRHELGPEHVETLAAMSNLASNLRSQGKLEESEALMVSVVEAHDKIPNRDEYHSLMFRLQLARVLVKSQRIAEGLSLMEIVIQGFEETLGSDNQCTIDAKSLQAEWIELNRKHTVAESSSVAEDVDDTGTQDSSLDNTNTWIRWLLQFLGESLAFTTEVLDTRSP